MSEDNKETPQGLIQRLRGFTEGPWVIDGGIIFGNEFGFTVPLFDLSEYEENESSIWDCNLIAAAPDLHRIATEQAAEIARLRNLVSEMADSLDYYSPLTGRTIETPTSRTFRAALEDNR